MNKNVELFKKSYKNGFEVYLNPKEKDNIIEYIDGLEMDLDSANSKLSELSKRCIKAIEYIKNHCDWHDICEIMTSDEVKNLKRILEGSNKKPNIISKNEMVDVNGKNFHCTCGANVFTRYDNNTFICNGCGNEYIGSDKE